jgi:hypothetical protein
MRLSGERGEGWFTGLYGIADAETLSLGPGARLLAHENVTLRPRRLTSYSLLDYGRTDRAG